MPIPLSTFLLPAGGNSFFLLEDKYVRGGLHVCVNAAERDAMNATVKKSGMLVVTQDDNRIWQLQGSDWLEFNPGGGAGPRRTVVHTENGIQPLQSVNFTLAMGRMVICTSVEVSDACQIEAYSTPDYSDVNPYKFIAEPGMLKDEGITLLSDGTQLRNRRYLILANEEQPELTDNLYWRITNLSEDTELDVALTVVFTPVEI